MNAGEQLLSALGDQQHDPLAAVKQQALLRVRAPSARRPWSQSRRPLPRALSLTRRASDAPLCSARACRIT